MHSKALMLGSTVRFLRRAVYFDTDDRAGAVALLNEWHAELDC